MVSFKFSKTCICFGPDLSEGVEAAPLTHAAWTFFRVTELKYKNYQFSCFLDTEASLITVPPPSPIITAKLHLKLISNKKKQQHNYHFI